MRYIPIISFVFLSILFVNCSSNRKTISNEDRNKIETLLSKHRRYAFTNLYEKSISKDEKKYNIKKCDSIFDLTSNELYNEYCINIDFYSEANQRYENKNYDALIAKWLSKDYSSYMPVDNPNLKTSMSLKRALDFYESNDLKKYIDSLRVVFLKKYQDNNLKSLNCIH
jgi:hypothetical protein